MEWFDMKPVLIKDKLQMMGYDIEELRIDNLVATNLTSEETKEGLVKSYYGDLQDVNGFFNNIVIQEYIDRRKIYCFLRYDYNDNIIREILCMFYDYFGLDKSLRGRMSEDEMINLKMVDIDNTLREWTFSDYVMRLDSDSHDRLLMFWIVKNINNENSF